MSDTKHVVLIHGMCARADLYAPARDAFEERGYTVHTPTLRYHELPLQKGANKIAPLGLRDYTDDLVKLIASLDTPPLLVGHSLGGLLAQLAAARTRHAGLVAACPSPAAGIFAAYPTPVRLSSRVWRGGWPFEHFLQSRPWAKPVYPPTWEQFRSHIANTQTEEYAREVFDDLVCESGRVLCELAVPWLVRAKTARVDCATITGPVLVIGAGADRIVPPRIARQTAARYQRGAYFEIPGSDHLVFSEEVLPVTMGHIDDWIARNHVLATA
jgi:pimeloyl-ACP methyl ester carboxylesterase